MNLRLRRSCEQGSATLVVLALLFIMAALALGNNRTLHHLHQELDLLEQRQLGKSPPGNPPLTIVPVAAPGLGASGDPQAGQTSPTRAASPEPGAASPAGPPPGP
jgi:hypothetical protein